jgi:DNA-binding XRE family transcriptional regulator
MKQENPIKKRRRELGLTQVELAVNARISLRSLQHYEAGDARPLLNQAQKLAVALKSDTVILFPKEAKI